jgi:hypothetical protein
MQLNTYQIVRRIILTQTVLLLAYCITTHTPMQTSVTPHINIINTTANASSHNDSVQPTKPSTPLHGVKWATTILTIN